MHIGMVTLRANRFPAFPSTYTVSAGMHATVCIRYPAARLWVFARGGQEDKGGDAFSRIAEVLGNRSSGLV